MDDPPPGHTPRQEQPIEPLPIGKQTGFQVPATAFGILKGGLDAHAQRLLVHPPSASRLIGNQDPGLAMVGVHTALRYVSIVSSCQHTTRPNHCCPVW